MAASFQILSNSYSPIIYLSVLYSLRYWQRHKITPPPQNIDLQNIVYWHTPTYVNPYLLKKYPASHEYDIDEALQTIASSPSSSTNKYTVVAIHYATTAESCVPE
jgi:hypothetical protein